MAPIDQALHHLNKHMKGEHSQAPIPFHDFLQEMAKDPLCTIRNVFMVFHDLVKSLVEGGVDEYQGDPESIHYVHWDFNRLFVTDSDNPFFADRLFANRFMHLVETLPRGSRQNKIYLFEGPHGSGKSTFLYNLLLQFEKFANTGAGCRYESVWRLDRKALDSLMQQETLAGVERLLDLLDSPETDKVDLLKAHSSLHSGEDFLEIVCPSHDHPLLQVPKNVRRNFLDDLFKNDEIKWKLFTEKEYEWVFSTSPCTICTSIYQALLARLQSPEKVLEMLYARPYRFNRRMGEGISVFNPGDMPLKKSSLSNEALQNRIDNLFQDSNVVRYIYSQFAKSNNGIYALMDLKGHNTDRLYQLHNILSEGVHKVEDIEESVNSLFLAVMNPEDKEKLDQFRSLSDRVEVITMPYILDINTEVQIYQTTFGRHLEAHFLPRVLQNFARVVISTRLNQNSPAMLEWIHDPAKYRLYCDSYLQLLKMEIYSGRIPTWLSDEDRQRLTAKRRRRIIDEAVTDGQQGVSGRESINLFNDFFTSCAVEDRLIGMDTLKDYFTKKRKDLVKSLPEGFLDALLRNYDYSVLQDIKEALYYYNEDQIQKDILNYLFAINFEMGTRQVCQFTGENLQITENFLAEIESRLLGPGTTPDQRKAFRLDTQKTYTAHTLTQEILLEEKAPEETALFRSLHSRYVHNLKERVLEPFLRNENFRRAIKDYNRSSFKTYDKKIQDDVQFLIENLRDKFGYTPKGAQEVCIYIIDNNLAHKYGQSL